MKLGEHCLEERVKGLQPSATLAIQEECTARLARGERVFRLGLGQSPFPVPSPVVEALRAHASEKDYLAVRGLSSLRQAVASFHRSRHGVDRGPDDVLVGPGSKELLFLLQLCFDAETLVPAPSWVSYAPQARILGRSLRWLPTSARSRLLIDPDALDAACSRGEQRARLLVLNSPSNPVSTALRADEMKALAAVCRKHGLLVLSDEIYGELHFGGSHVSFAHFYEEGTIVSSGLSKWCGAGGWRLGTFLFPPELRWLLSAMASVASETYSSTSAPIQHAAVRAFQMGPDIERYLRLARGVLQLLTSWSAARLRETGVEVCEPEAAYYLFVDASPLRARLSACGVEDDVSLCRRLLKEAGVAALPGSEFGMDRRDLVMRLALVDFDGARVLSFADQSPLDEEFIRTHMLTMHRAITALCGWLQGR
jgi:aspartate aminotransferase